MNLADRLKQLQGQPTGVGDSELARRLRQAGSRQRRRPPPSTDRLARALGADAMGPGWVMRRLVRSDVSPPVDPDRLVQLPEVCHLASADWVYLDTETTGLSGGSGTLAFMVGVARYRPTAGLEVRQYLLSGFAGEAGMLQSLLNWMGQGSLVVSYNGKCFDMPLLRTRFTLQRIRPGLDEVGQLDLMHGVRRAYRQTWPDCRLQTAERRLLGIHRRDDLPGAEAPAAWRAWLERGDAGALSGVLRHNEQDVVSLALLHRRLAADQTRAADPDASVTAMARAWQRVGRADHAHRLLWKARDDLDDAGGMALAASCTKRGEWAQAEAIWLALAGRGSEEAAIELSKYYEHRVRDYARAMRYACDSNDARRLLRLERKHAASRQLPLPV